MAPPQNAQPVTWNLPFQPLAGNQISIPMFDVSVGLESALMRQNAGSASKRGPRPPPPPRAPAGAAAGGTNAPGATRTAPVIIVYGTASVLASASHGAA